VVHALLSLHLGFKFMSGRMGNSRELVATARWGVHEGFNTRGRGNSVGRSTTARVQRDMGLFIALDQHKSMVVFLKLRDNSLRLALLHYRDSLL
jgi:hypothetical protein